LSISWLEDFGKLQSVGFSRVEDDDLCQIRYSFLEFFRVSADNRESVIMDGNDFFSLDKFYCPGGRVL